MDMRGAEWNSSTANPQGNQKAFHNYRSLMGRRLNPDSYWAGAIKIDTHSPLNVPAPHSVLCFKLWPLKSRIVSRIQTFWSFLLQSRSDHPYYVTVSCGNRPEEGWTKPLRSLTHMRVCRESFAWNIMQPGCNDMFKEFVFFIF